MIRGIMVPKEVSMRLLVTASFVLSVVASPSSAVVFDSYDALFPPNPALTSGTPILFIGTICDGTNCPPDPTASNGSFDEAVQSGLAGIPQGYRLCNFAAEGFDAAQDKADLAIRDGALHIANRGVHAIRTNIEYGGFGHEMGLDLAREGTDRFELDIVNEGTTFTPFQLDFFFYSIKNGSRYPASYILSYQVTAPGTIRLPYSQFFWVPGTSDFYDVDWIQYRFIHFPAGNSVRIEELRTAATPTMIEPATWGRIKAGYR
jgi:hypothetical protein